MKQKKWIAVTAAIAVAAGSLIGCNGNPTGTVDGNTKPTLKFLMNNIKSDPNSYPVAKMLEEKTGYRVEYDLLPNDNAEEKLNLVIASQEEYDGIQILGTMRSKFADFARQGALLPLDDLVEKYGTNMKEKFLKETWEAGSTDGHIYGIVTWGGPAKNEDAPERDPRIGGLSSLLLVRTDLMKKAGVEKMPETVSEFTAMLRAIKETDPAGTGMKNVPLTTVSTLDLPGLPGAFGLACKWVVQEDGTLKHQVETQQYKNYLSYLRTLYSEGLLDAELPTNKLNNIQEKYSAGRAAVMPMPYWDAATIMDALDQNCPGYSLEYLMPLKGEDGSQGYGSGGSIINRVAVIPKAAKHPEDMIKWMDRKLDDETFRNLVIGEEGVHFEKRDNGYFPLSPKFFDERSLANDFMTGADDRGIYQEYWKARVRKDDRIYEKFQSVQSEQLLQYAQINPDADAPVLESMKNESALETLANDFALGIITGTQSLEQYDSFLEKWRTEGGSALVKEMNEWYAENKE